MQTYPEITLEVAGATVTLEKNSYIRQKNHIIVPALNKTFVLEQAKEQNDTPPPAFTKNNGHIRLKGFEKSVRPVTYDPPEPIKKGVNKFINNANTAVKRHWRMSKVGSYKSRADYHHAMAVAAEKDSNPLFHNLAEGHAHAALAANAAHHGLTREPALERHQVLHMQRLAPPDSRFKAKDTIEESSYTVEHADRPMPPRISEAEPMGFGQRKAIPIKKKIAPIPPPITEERPVFGKRRMAAPVHEPIKQDTGKKGLAKAMHEAKSFWHGPMRHFRIGLHGSLAHFHANKALRARNVGARKFHAHSAMVHDNLHEQLGGNEGLSPKEHGRMVKLTR